MAEKEYEMFMSSLKFLNDEDIVENLPEETDDAKFSVVYSTSLKERCMLREIKGRDVSDKYKAIQKVRSKYLTIVYDIFYDGSSTYILEEFLSDGERLEDKIKSGKIFTTKETYDIISDISKGLGAFHRRKPPIVHNDVKPANIWIRADGTVKVFDYDISRTVKKNQSDNTEYACTPQYASPEQQRGVGQTTPRSDVYSVGLIMHKMLSGVHYGGKVTCKGPLKRVVKKCVKEDPSKRYSSAGKLPGAMRRAMNKWKFDLVVALVVAVCILLGWGFAKMQDGDNVGDPDPSTNDAYQQIVQHTENDGISSIITEKTSTTSPAVEISQTQQWSKLIHKTDNLIRKIINIGRNDYVIFENNENSVILTFSDDRKVVFDSFKEGYTQDIVYNYITDELYVVSYNDNEAIFFVLNDELSLNEVGTVEVNSIRPCENELAFFSNGYLYFPPSYDYNVIDVNNLYPVGNVQELYFHSNVVLGDDIYNQCSPGLRQTDALGQTVREISVDDIKYTYSNCQKIYFLCNTDGVYYIKSFDGENVVDEYQFDATTSITVKDIKGFCVVNDTVLMYGTNIVKEYKMK